MILCHELSRPAIRDSLGLSDSNFAVISTIYDPTAYDRAVADTNTDPNRQVRQLQNIPEYTAL